MCVSAGECFCNVRIAVSACSCVRGCVCACVGTSGLRGDDGRDLVHVQVP